VATETCGKKPSFRKGRTWGGGRIRGKTEHDGKTAGRKKTEGDGVPGRHLNKSHAGRRTSEKKKKRKGGKKGSRGKGHRLMPTVSPGQRGGKAKKEPGPTGGRKRV